MAGIITAEDSKKEQVIENLKSALAEFEKEKPNNCLGMFPNGCDFEYYLMAVVCIHGYVA